MNPFKEERPTYLLGLVRVAMSVLVLLHVYRMVRELLRDGYFGDVFHFPVVPEALVPTRSAYGAWLALQAIACVLAAIGVRARPMLLFATSSSLYVLLCDRLQYHNNRYVLLLLAFLLAFAPCDRSFLLVRGPRNLGAGEPGPVWAQRLMQVQVSLVYLASSGGKLIDSDWREGQVMLLRGLKTIEHLTNMGVHVPAWLAALLSSPLVFNVLSKAGIATEMFVALGLWHARSRPYALWVGVMFHLGIEITAHVELFSYLMWSSYVLFVRPECRERVLCYRADLAAARGVARAVRALDWLARFRVEAETEEGADRQRAKDAIGMGFWVVDRDATEATGLRGISRIARALPLLFPLWLPLHVTALLTRRHPARPEHAPAL